MIDSKLAHKNLLILVTCMVTICILTMGLRGAETPRGKGSKPPHRAVLAREVKKSAQQAVEQQFDRAAFPVQAALPSDRDSLSLPAVAVAPAKVFTGPIPSRAPPLFPA